MAPAVSSDVGKISLTLWGWPLPDPASLSLTPPPSAWPHLPLPDPASLRLTPPPFAWACGADKAFPVSPGEAKCLCSGRWSSGVDNPNSTCQRSEVVPDGEGGGGWVYIQCGPYRDTCEAQLKTARETTTGRQAVPFSLKFLFSLLHFFPGSAEGRRSASTPTILPAAASCCTATRMCNIIGHLHPGRTKNSTGCLPQSSEKAELYSKRIAVTLW